MENWLPIIGAQAPCFGFFDLANFLWWAVFHILCRSLSYVLSYVQDGTVFYPVIKTLLVVERAIVPFIFFWQFQNTFSFDFLKLIQLCFQSFIKLIVRDTHTNLLLGLRFYHISRLKDARVF